MILFYSGGCMSKQRIEGKMIKILLITVLIVAVAMALFCVKLLFRKDGEFDSMHIHDSQAMKDRKIHCVMDQDREARQANKAY